MVLDTRHRRGNTFAALSLGLAVTFVLTPALGARPSGVIRLLAAEFDPIRDGEPDFGNRLPDGPPLRAAADPYRLVQFHAKVTAGVRRALVARGVEVVGYVPERTLIVRLPPSGSDRLLQSVPDRRFVGRFRPGYKLSPDLLRAPGAEGETVSVYVFLFPQENPAPIAAALRERIEGARVASTRRGSRPRIAAELPAARLHTAAGALIRDPAVQFVARRFPLELHNDNSVWIGQSYDRVNGPAEAQAADPKPYPLSATIWNRGLTGTGQIVAVADTGLEYDMCFFADAGQPVLPQTVIPPGDLLLQPAHRKILAVNAPQPASYSTDGSFRHGTHVTASVAADDSTNPSQGQSPGHDHGDGMAPGAKIIFEDISGSVGSACITGIVVASLEDLLAQEYNAGARISTNSWGSSGGYESAGLAADVSSWDHEDFLVLFSAGNDGASALNAFAACKNCLAVGATENYDATFVDALGILDPENMTAFSGHGPTVDGRIKPDVVAPGFRVDSARFPVEYIADAGDPSCDAGDPDVCFPSFGGCYVTDPLGTCHSDLLIGTSMATPIAAGLAALARQYFADGFYPSGSADPEQARTPSAALLKAILINGARNMTGRLYERRDSPVDFGALADAPANVQGWGRVMLDDALYFAGESRGLRVIDVAHAEGLATGETIRTQLSVTSSAEPLKLTLVWTDAPGQPVAGGALIDDLDLELTTPDGTVYAGNQWTADDLNVPGDRVSIADPPGRDAVNNVEGILLKSPPAGLYEMRVIGRDVPGERSPFTQGAAMVTTGAVGSCTALAPPRNPRIDGFGAGQIDLAWDPVPGALGYTIYRNATACSDPMSADRVFSVSAGSTTLADTDVQALAVYNYTVRAVVSIEGCETADSPCVSALAVDAGVPPPVPDGLAGTPLLVGKGATALRLDLAWDTLTCPAEGYHLLYGRLDGVSGHEIAGSKCSLSTSGAFGWFGVPPTDLWFVVVSDSAGAIEGGWGAQSGGVPRGDGSPSGECGMLVRDESGTCP